MREAPVNAKVFGDGVVTIAVGPDGASVWVGQTEVKCHSVSVDDGSVMADPVDEEGKRIMSRLPFVTLCRVVREL